MKRLVLVLVILLFGIFLWAALPARAEVKERGEICFDMFPEIVFEGVGGQLQVGVLSFGAGHLVLDGKIIPLISFAPIGRVYGTATLDGDNITVSLTVTPSVSSQSDTVSFLHIVLNATTKSGTWTAVPVATSSQKFGGTISIGSCQH